MKSEDFKIFLEQMEKLLEELKPQDNKISIYGDFNVDMNDFKCKDNASFRLLNDTFNLKLNIENEHTRFGKNSKSLLDNCISNYDKGEILIFDSTLSDHYSIASSTTLNGSKGEKILKRFYSARSNTIFKNDMKDLINSKRKITFQKLHDAIIMNFNKNFPLKVQKTKIVYFEMPLAKQMELGKLIREKNENWELFKAFKFKKYKKIVNRVNKKIKK